MNSKETGRPKSRRAKDRAPAFPLWARERDRGTPTRGGTVQYLMVAGEEEAEVTRRLLNLKDEFLLRTPGFREDQLETESQLVRNATSEQDLMRNHDVASEFADRWDLPFNRGDLSADLAYLFERPFSNAPLVVGSWFGVLRDERTRPPLLELLIDLRLPETEIRKRVKRIVREARGKWVSEGGRAFTTRNVARHATADHLETLLEILDQDEKGLGLAELGARLSLRHDRSNVSRWRDEAQKFLRNEGYRTILPSSHAREFLSLMACRGEHGPVPTRLSPPSSIR